VNKTAINIILSVFLALLSLPPGSPGAEPEEFFPAEDIRRAQDIISLEVTGTIQMGGLEGTVRTLYAAPDNLFMSFDLGIIKFSQGFDGRTAWMVDQNGQLVKITGEDKKVLVNTAYVTGFSYLDKDRMPGKLEFWKDTVVEGARYLAILAMPEGGDSLWLFYNTIHRRVDITREKFDEVPVYTYGSDFREVNGIEMPFVYTASAPIPQFNSVIRLTGVQVNIPVDSAIFRMETAKGSGSYFPDKVDSIVIPVRYHEGHIYIRVSVNGSDEKDFILDTGAGANVIDKVFAEKLGLEWEGELPAKGMAGYGSAAYARIDSISVGGITLYNQTVGVIDHGGMGLRIAEGLGGLLGYDLLSRFPFKVKYSSAELIFYNPESFNSPDSELCVNFEPIMKVPSVRAKYVGVEGRFLVDLGNALGLVLHKSFVKRHNLEATFSDIKGMEGRIRGIGGGAEVYAATGTVFTLGPIEITNPPLIVAEAEMGAVESEVLNGNIGNLLLEKFSILMDYERKKMYILPP
jgi:predicted aspartyl protease